MSWLSPESFAWLLAAPAVFLLYLLRSWSKPQQTATMFLWRKAIAQRSPWRRLRPWVSAGWRAAVVVLLVFAMASPMLGPMNPQPRTFVFVLDTTASMKATDVAPSRFEAAKSAALAQLENFGPLDRGAVVLAGEEPRVFLRPTDNVETITAALEFAEPRDTGGDFAAAVRIADEMLRDVKAAAILAFTDTGANLTAKNGSLHVYAAARASNNVAVVSVAARPLPTPTTSEDDTAEPPSSQLAEVVARLQSTEASSARIAWKLDGQVVDQETLTFVNGQAASTVRLDRAGIAAIEILDNDHLTIDNRAAISLNGLDDVQTAYATGSHGRISSTENGSLTAPDKEVLELKPADGQPLTLGPFDLAGDWRWKSASGEQVWSVALLNSEESRLSRDLDSNSVSFEPGATPAAPAQGWFFLLALLTWTGEWLAFILGVTE